MNDKTVKLDEIVQINQVSKISDYDSIIRLVNNHHNDLQLYGNNIFCTENSLGKIDDLNNMSLIIEQYRYTMIGSHIYLQEKNMTDITFLVKNILDEIKIKRTSAKSFVANIYDIKYFGQGNTSPNIILEYNFDENNKSHNHLIKLMPSSWVHQYGFMTENHQNQKFIETYIEAPLCAIFLKEAWIISFLNSYIKKFSPAFDSVCEGVIINGFPSSREKFSFIKKGYLVQKTRSKNKIRKKWVDELINITPHKDLLRKNNKSYKITRSRSRTPFNIISEQLFVSNYFGIQMSKCNFTLSQLVEYIKEIFLLKNLLEEELSDSKIMDDNTFNKLSSLNDKMLNSPIFDKSKRVPSNMIERILEKQVLLNAKMWELNRLNTILEDEKIPLDFIFEYLYAKMILGYIGNIVLIDDHFDNIMVIDVDYIRHYEIITKEHIYNFYMQSSRLVQFIDLERYLFNGSEAKSYICAYLSNISIVNSEYVYDKSIHSFMDPRKFPEYCVSSQTDYDILIDILSNQNIYICEKFCEIMQNYLPSKYQTKPSEEIKIIKTFIFDFTKEDQIIKKEFINAK